jgi:hypothetical protein
MKKITLSLCVLGLATFFACTKERTLNPTTNPTETASVNTTKTGSVKKQKDPPDWWWAKYDNDNSGWCSGKHLNCIVIKTVVVRPHAARAIFEASVNGSAEAIAAIFRMEELSDLTNYCLVDGLAEKLHSGNYYITRSNDDETKACYIAGKSYPVTAENMEFAFQFPYGDIE